ncbi:MFS transporter superfamily protein [Pleurotus pulmonarius]
MPERHPSVRSVASDAVVEVYNVRVGTPRRDPNGRSKWSAICLVMTCTAAMVINSANLAYVSIALPAISKDLAVPLDELQWVMTAYALTSGCFLLMIGRIADLYGRKRVFMAGSAFSIVFTIACGLVQTKEGMFVLRAFQGIGAAATIPAALGILAQSFPPSKARALAFTTFSTGNPLGGGLGMTLGGVLTEFSPAGWRSSFFVFAGISSVCIVGGYFFIDADKPTTEKNGRVDWIGAFLVTSGLTLLTVVLSQGEAAPKQWASPYIIVLIIFGVIFMVAFFMWQARLERIQNDLDYPRSWLTPPPLMKVSFWTRAKGRLAAVLWIAALTFCVFRSWQYWVQLYYQNYERLSPVETMVRVLPMFIMGILCNFFMAQIISRVPIVYIVAAGAAITSTAALLFAVIDPTAPYWAFGFPAAIFSVWGADFVFSSGTLFVAKTVAQHEQSLAGGVMQTMTQLGTTLGVPITTIVYNRVVQQRSREMRWRLNPMGSNAPRPAMLAGYRAAQWCAFAFGCLAIILALIFLPGVGIVGHRGPPAPAQGTTDKGPFNPPPAEDEKKQDLEAGSADLREDVPFGGHARRNRSDSYSTTGVSTVTHVSDADSLFPYSYAEPMPTVRHGVDFSLIGAHEEIVLKLGDGMGVKGGIRVEDGMSVKDETKTLVEEDHLSDTASKIRA